MKIKGILTHTNSNYGILVFQNSPINPNDIKYLFYLIKHDTTSCTTCILKKGFFLMKIYYYLF